MMTGCDGVVVGEDAGVHRWLRTAMLDLDLDLDLDHDLDLDGDHDLDLDHDHDLDLDGDHDGERDDERDRGSLSVLVPARGPSGRNGFEM